MGLIALVGLPVAYWFLNRLRGKYGAGGPIVGAITGVVVFLFTGMPILAAGIAIAYALGEAPGWGRWIKLLNTDYTQDDYMKFHREPTRGKEIHRLANKISRESKDYKKYARTAMALRGLLWWLPVALVPTLMGFPLCLPVGLLGASMGIVCSAVGKRYPAPNKDYWKAQEHVNGLVHGIMLGTIIVMVSPQ